MWFWGFEWMGYFFLLEFGDFFLGFIGFLFGLLRFYDVLKLFDVCDVCCFVFVVLEFFFWDEWLLDWK